MIAETLYAILKQEEQAEDAGDGARKAGGGEDRILCSPAVGLFRGQTPDGAGVVPEMQIGTLLILDRVVPLLAPPGSGGIVVQGFLEPGLHQVDYGRELYRLGSAVAAATGERKITAAGARELGSRQFAIRSPTDGVFYRRPDPQSPAYVEVGDVVERGNTLGLVEVMKCFNQVRFAGTDLPARARVVEIPLADGAEIRFNQALFILEREE